MICIVRFHFAISTFCKLAYRGIRYSHSFMHTRNATWSKDQGLQMKFNTTIIKTEI